MAPQPHAHPLLLLGLAANSLSWLVTVCGFMATDRMDVVKENVFVVPSRINSTWGGKLIHTTLSHTHSLLYSIQRTRAGAVMMIENVQFCYRTIMID
jgi:hypothetical protein